MVVRFGNQVIVIMLLLFALLGLASGALAAEIPQAPIAIDRVDPQVGALGLDGQAAVSAHVVGRYGACLRPVHEPVVSRQGQTVTVSILADNYSTPNASCPQDILTYDQTIDLGTFSLGSYNLRVNDYTTSFSVPGTLNNDVLLGQLWQQIAGLIGES